MLKYSASFSVKNNAKDSAAPVRLRISFNSNRPELYTGVLVKPSEWDKETQRLFNRKDPRNKELSAKEAIIDDIFKEYDVVHKRFPTTEEVIDRFNVHKGKTKAKENNPLLQDVFVEFIDNSSQKNQWKVGRIKKYDGLKNHFCMFNRDLRINSITEDTLLKLIKYYQTGPIDYKTGKKKPPHRNTTVQKNMLDFMALLKWASKKKIYTGDLHDTFEPTFKGTAGDLKELVYLEWNELSEMYYKDFGSDRLNHVRDVFAFCCFTGQRFSDVKTLQHSDIREGYFLNTTEKTIDPLRIDLNDYSSEILDRYKDFRQPLPIISHDKTNEYIKEIGQIMEWNDLISEVYFVGEKRFDVTYHKKDVISTHAGRRTFVVNAIKMNIPTIVVRSWTGHKDERAMKPYTKILNEHKAEEMKKFNFKTPPQIPPPEEI